ncbi:DUF397 domain-containing protein [Streptomyces sp. Rer75]|uniref:DUF397 domain-containing protein n=1 Tax=Streptomyces sp. Rer75 TaxID=2750011 RepID=UPI0015CFEF01|nr:DUF397 domain-containing protein [Streptomyces sp. Rer75]QLH24291.1 DUF397 domain-containing protein [Streptomyces sp. Rer75]
MSTELAWFKSSYSGGSGNACVEVAIEWRKSSYSGGEGQACIEIAACPSAVHVRDSKDTAIPALTVTAPAWRSFVGFAAGQPIN